jgi:non-ribosomal peptide synthetase component F
LQGEILDLQLSYWTQQLTGVPALELPGDRPRSVTAARCGGVRSRALTRALVNELRSLGRRENATLFMTLMAGFEALLHRYSGQDSFAVGTPIAGRTRSEIENLIGFFVNTLVLPADLAGDPSFRELLRRVRSAALGAYAHQDLPFERLVNALHAEREGNRTPLFQVMLAVQNAPLPPLESPELTITPLEPEIGAAKFDLILFVIDLPDKFELTMEYDAGLFDAATIDRMLEHMQRLLEGAVAEPDQPVGALPMLSEAERQLMLQGSDDAATALDDLDDLSEEDLDALLSRMQSEDGAVNE